MVKDEGIYVTSNSFKKTLPYVQNRNLDVGVPVRVISRRIELGPPRHISLKLGLTNWNTGELTGSHLYVKFHYIPGVKDFLVFRELYDKFVEEDWKPEDRFRSLNDDGKWKFGKVKSKAAKSGRFLESKFLCYVIEWDEDYNNLHRSVVEQLSPWEMERIPDFVGKTRRKEGMFKKASTLEIRAVLYKSSPADWPPSGDQDAECKRLSSLVEQVVDLHVAYPFVERVNFDEFPDYALCIEYPIDLKTIKARLDSRYYRRIESLKLDVLSLATNAERYNSSSARITTHAKILRDVLLHFITNSNSSQDVRQVYHDIIRKSSDFYCGQLRDLEGVGAYGK
ncbi:unnamed protein product [Orchesella dallaii]|uniref:Bromo domain-containing protein n=1 Tax=Orchesella dallaii TaxID=48710 RepID=A0ABP1RPB1_9HEXA